MPFIFYPEIEPFPTTYVSHTYPEKGHHLHHVPLPYLASKTHRMFHDRDHDVHQPKADVRETMKNFYLEVELPGTNDKSQMHLRWTSLRTLLISGHLTRPEIPEEELVDETAPAPASETAPAQPEGTEAPAAPATTTTPVTRYEPHLTVHERQVGELLRAFNFPVEVDRDNTHARLEAGLLRIVVPKLSHEQVPHQKVEVHIPENEEVTLT